jgi:hypothetical protein
MFKQIRREEGSKTEHESLMIDMTLLKNRTEQKIKHSTPIKKVKSVPIPEDMLDNVYASILTDLPKISEEMPIKTPRVIKVSTPAPVQKTPASVQKTPAPVQKTPAPVQKTPAPVQKTPAPVQKTPAKESLRSEPINIPSRAEIKAAINLRGMYKNMDDSLPPTELDIGVAINNTPKTKKTKIKKPEQPDAEQTSYDDKKPKTKKESKLSKTGSRPGPVVDEAYIKQHTVDMEYIEITDPEQIRLSDHVKYLNKDGKLLHAFVRDKFKDKETDTYKFKLSMQENGGFGWTINYTSMQKTWRRPAITNSLERNVELMIKFLDLKYNGEFSEFTSDPDRYISIFNRLRR